MCVFPLPPRYPAPTSSPQFGTGSAVTLRTPSSAANIQANAWTLASLVDHGEPNAALPPLPLSLCLASSVTKSFPLSLTLSLARITDMFLLVGGKHVAVALSGHGADRANLPSDERDIGPKPTEEQDLDSGIDRLLRPLHVLGHALVWLHSRGLVHAHVSAQSTRWFAVPDSEEGECLVVDWWLGPSLGSPGTAADDAVAYYEEVRRSLAGVVDASSPLQVLRDAADREPPLVDFLRLAPFDYLGYPSALRLPQSPPTPTEVALRRHDRRSAQRRTLFPPVHSTSADAWAAWLAAHDPNDVWRDAAHPVPTIVSLPRVVRGDGGGGGERVGGVPESDSLLILVPVSLRHVRLPRTAKEKLGFVDGARSLAATDTFVARAVQQLDRGMSRVGLFRALLRWRASPVPTLSSCAHRLLVAAANSAEPIPESVRVAVWAALMGEDEEDEAATAFAAALALPAAEETCHQIGLDVRRCHQYHPLISSSAGAAQLSAVLRAWTSIALPDLVYWQGVDSVAAVFHVRLFNRPALTFTCLRRFVARHLRDLYAPDNHACLQSTLVLYRQLLAYVDPELASHFSATQFAPDLYAIPWFLTSFTHVLPVDDIGPLMDAIIAGPSSGGGGGGFALCVAVAIVRSLRTAILAADFNGLILLFSSLPALPVSHLVSQARELFSSTPTSILSSSCLSRSSAAPLIAAADVLAAPARASFAVVDVRSDDAFAAAAIPGAFRFDVTKLDDRAVSRLEAARGTPIVVVDEEGAEGGDAISFASKLSLSMGYTHVAVLHGGMAALRQQGLLPQLMDHLAAQQ